MRTWLTEDAHGIVVSVQGAIDDRGDPAFGVMVQEGLLQDALARARFAQHQAEAALLGVDSEDVEDLLLASQQRERFAVEGIALETKRRADHKLLEG